MKNKIQHIVLFTQFLSLNNELLSGLKISVSTTYTDESFIGVVGAMYDNWTTPDIL